MQQDDSARIHTEPDEAGPMKITRLDACCLLSKPENVARGARRRSLLDRRPTRAGGESKGEAGGGRSLSRLCQHLVQRGAMLAKPQQIWMGEEWHVRLFT